MDIIKEVINKIPSGVLLAFITVAALLFLIFAVVIIIVIIKGRSLKLGWLEVGNKNAEASNLGFTSNYAENNNQTSLKNYTGVYEVFHLAPHTERVAKAAFEISIKDDQVDFKYNHPLFDYVEGRYKIALGNIFVTLFGKENGIEMILILKEPVGKYEFIWGICTGLSERNEPVAVEICLKKTNHDNIAKVTPCFVERAAVPQEISLNLNNITV